IFLMSSLGFLCEPQQLPQTNVVSAYLEDIGSSYNVTPSSCVQADHMASSRPDFHLTTTGDLVLCI
ncbi:hypothetical protein XENOCAPTIV_026282, partial [Xenoophorus captivus]